MLAVLYGGGLRRAVKEGWKLGLMDGDAYQLAASLGNVENTQEERQYGTRVSIVAPGLVDTDMGVKLISLLPGPNDMRERDAAAPFSFVCQPEDIANAVAFLCGSEGRYITNQRITIDGGGF